MGLFQPLQKSSEHSECDYNSFKCKYEENIPMATCTWNIVMKQLLVGYV